MKKTSYLIMGLLLLCSCAQTGKNPQLPDYLNESLDIETRVEDALSRMTLEEKVRVIHAQSKFSSAGVPRLGIPEIWTTDGPHGIRPEVLWDEWNQAGQNNDSCVAFPALTCLAATWNEQMASLYGKCIGEEARYREKDVILGPGVNIYRTPLNGRNFEYMGEDPFLAGKLAAKYIQGVQANGVAACVKHYALNNQESLRNEYEAFVSPRALHEIYLPAFKYAVTEGGAWAVMGSYNIYRSEHGCHNQYLLNQVLKHDWKFDGVAISDWGGTHDTDEAITNGLDMEFGTDGPYSDYYLASPYMSRLISGKATENVLDEKVRRVLKLIMRTSMKRDKPFGSLCSDEHYAAARQIATEGIVLLKNENSLLPLSTNRYAKIAVIGENAIKKMTVGGGSSSLKVQREISPLEGIISEVGNKGKVLYERGYVGDTTTIYNRVSSGQNLQDPRSEKQLISDAVRLARESDVVIFIGGLNKSDHQDCEGSDRLSLGLPYVQDKLITALAEANPNISVVLISGNAVSMPWIDKVPSVVEAWFLGSQAGPAIADILFGKVNPSGKLPFTFPVSLEYSPAHATNSYQPLSTIAKYEEDIFVGYRWADMHDKSETLFPFGHGLSYTSFDYSNLKLDKQSLNENGVINVSLEVSNTGKVSGKEIVQFYIGDNESSLKRPVKELKGFQKVSLIPGESHIITFQIIPELLKYYDDRVNDWVAEPGEFTLYIGSSSRDIRLNSSFTYLH